MKYGPRKTASLLAQAKVMRTEEKLIWRVIAKRLGVEPHWLKRHRYKLEGMPEGRILTIPKTDLDQALAKIKAMREQKVTWETIGETFGLGWLKIYRAYRYHTKGSVKT